MKQNNPYSLIKSKPTEVKPVTNNEQYLNISENLAKELCVGFAGDNPGAEFDSKLLQDAYNTNSGMGKLMKPFTCYAADAQDPAIRNYYVLLKDNISANFSISTNMILTDIAVNVYRTWMNDMISQYQYDYGDTNVDMMKRILFLPNGPAMIKEAYKAYVDIETIWGILNHDDYVLENMSKEEANQKIDNVINPMVILAANCITYTVATDIFKQAYSELDFQADYNEYSTILGDMLVDFRRRVFVYSKSMTHILLSMYLGTPEKVYHSELFDLCKNYI